MDTALCELLYDRKHTFADSDHHWSWVKPFDPFPFGFSSLPTGMNPFLSPPSHPLPSWTYPSSSHPKHLP